MKFIREFESGAGGSDPRNKWYAVYLCAACGYEDNIHSSNRDTFDRRDRRCPKCGAMDAQDLRKNLELKKASLEAEHKRIQGEIEGIIAQMNCLPVKEEKAST